MLTSELGIRLMLWTGSTIPTPPRPGVIAALTRAQVTNDEDSGDGFQLTFALGHDGLADWDLLDGSLDPMKRVLIAVVLGVVPEVLIDGIITQHSITPSNEPGRSTLTVTGTNLSVMLDLEEKNDPKKNQPDFVIVAGILGSYATYGLVPAVTPTTDFPIELQRIPRQRETDLACIRRLAGDNGFVFYIEPITIGVNKAYWGPVIRAGVPQPALTMNMGARTNVTSLSFSNDALAPVGASGSFVEPMSKMVIPIPALPPLRLPPLARTPTSPVRKVLLREAANENPAKAALASASAATQAPDPVSGQGQLETVRYGSVLRARRLVGVRGSGDSYDGFFYVKSVTHEITKGSYTQSFRLARDGTGSLLPMVPV
jgi:hypothetical protein